MDRLHLQKNTVPLDNTHGNMHIFRNHFDQRFFTKMGLIYTLWTTVSLIFFSLFANSDSKFG